MPHIITYQTTPIILGHSGLRAGPHVYVIFVGLSYVAGLAVAELIRFLCRLLGLLAAILPEVNAFFMKILMFVYFAYVGQVSNRIYNSGFNIFQPINPFEAEGALCNHTILKGIYDRHATLKHVGVAVGPPLMIYAYSLHQIKVPNEVVVPIFCVGLLLALISVMKKIQQVLIIESVADARVKG
jgi:hypothetical protein